MRPGGLGEEESANEHVQSLIHKLEDEIKLKAGRSLPHLEAVSFKRQVVAGTNYFVKVKAGNEYLHVRVFEPLPCYGDKPELSSVQLPKLKEDSIEYF